MNEQSGHSDDELEPVAHVLSLTAAYYGDVYCCKELCYTSALTGAAWVVELEEGHYLRIFRNFRMTRDVFVVLCDEVERSAPLSAWAHIGVKEKVAIFCIASPRMRPTAILWSTSSKAGKQCTDTKII